MPRRILDRRLANVLSRLRREPAGRPASFARAAIAAVLLFGLFGVTAQGARAAAPAKTDILLMFDTTGSMGSALSAAAAQVTALTGNIDSRLPDVQYGVAEVRDYAKYDSGTDPYAYKVNQAITADRGAVTAAINTLVAKGGGDSPEAYGGALAAATAGTGFGWRPGARRLVVLIADNVPHDDDLNLGIPADKQTQASPWNTGADPGPDGAVGTADDIDWQTLLDTMAYNGVSLAYVLFKGNSTYLPYWNIWATRTGGAAVDATDSDLGTKIADLAATGATTELPACPVGSARDAAGICDARHVTGVYVGCNRGPNPGDSSICTATVGDGATTETPTSPTGQVKFTALNGGGFPNGDTCTLVPTSGSPSVSSCNVRYTPKVGSWEFPDIVAEYGGGDKHRPSSSRTSLITGPVFGPDGKSLVLADGEPVSLANCGKNADTLTGKGPKAARAAINRRFPGGTLMDPRATWGDVLSVCFEKPAGYAQVVVGGIVQASSIVTGPAVTGGMITVAVGLPNPVTSYGLGAASVPAGAAVSYGTYKLGEGLRESGSKQLDDPPDPKFQQTVKPKSVKAVTFVTKNRKDRKQAALLAGYVTTQLKIAALGNAIGATLDKAGGAKLAGNTAYQGKQTRLARSYSKKMIALLITQRQQAAAVQTAIRRLPGVNVKITKSMFVAPTSAKAKLALKRYGQALDKKRKGLNQLGFTNADKTGLLAFARNPSIDDAALAIPKDLADLVAGTDARKFLDLEILTQRYWLVEPSVVAAAALK